MEFAGLKLEDSYRAAEQMARRKMPHLYRVARLFEDRERFLAFCAAYASMRWVDDLVDEGRHTKAQLAFWEEEIGGNFAGHPGSSEYGPALADTLRRFQISREPWTRLAAAMRYDAEHDGFETYQRFLDYAEGATVAPAAVFATLLLVRPDGDAFSPALPFPRIRDAVRAAAIGCYEVHILRDARMDIEAGRNYFPGDELTRYHLEGQKTMSAEWRSYLRAYAMRTRGGWEPALADLQDIEGPMSAREKLMLHLLVEFYGRSLQKIMRLNCNVWGDVHWPEVEEIRVLLRELAARYEPGVDLEALAVRVVEDV
jgi:phytoene/squalene synthetase